MWHTRGRVNLPTSQLERGWVNTNALTVQHDLRLGEQTALGKYVNLCFFYAVLTGQSPVGLPFRRSTCWPFFKCFNYKALTVRRILGKSLFTYLLVGMYNLGS
jgi:hypothetical protein